MRTPMSRLLVLAVSTAGLAAGATGWSASALAAPQPAVVSPAHPNPGPDWVWVRDYNGKNAHAACDEGIDDLVFQGYDGLCLANVNSPIWSLYRSRTNGGT